MEDLGGHAERGGMGSFNRILMLSSRMLPRRPVGKRGMLANKAHLHPHWVIEGIVNDTRYAFRLPKAVQKIALSNYLNISFSYEFRMSNLRVVLW